MNKRGFTLIELLAIITILAIIALITTPIIMDFISDSNKKTFESSVHGLYRTIEQDYTQHGYIDGQIYTISENKIVNISDNNRTDNNITFTGKLENGVGTAFAVYDNNSEKLKIIIKVSNDNYCAKNSTTGLDDYTINNNDCDVSLIEYIDTNEDNQISLGDKVIIGIDGFWVIAPPANGKVKLLARYNIGYDSRQVSSTKSTNYKTSTFADENYWKSATNFNTNSIGEKEIYRTSDGEDTANNLKDYINNYKTYLVDYLGISDITDVRLMTYDEAYATGCRVSNPNVAASSSDSLSCPAYIANQAYWLGTQSLYQAYNQSDNRIWSIYQNSSYRYLFNGLISSKRGIRPLIIINQSALNN